MSYIDMIPPDQAEGRLKKEFEKAIKRSGRIWKIVHLMSQNGDTLYASMHHYMAVMYGPSPLSRAQREMLATVVSRANNCFY